MHFLTAKNWNSTPIRLPKFLPVSEDGPKEPCDFTSDLTELPARAFMPCNSRLTLAYCMLVHGVS